MERMRLPKKVKVGGVIFDVVYPYIFTEDPNFCGLHESFVCKLKIGGNNGELGRPNQKIIETFIHEVIHAVDFIYCGAVLEEDSVNLLAKAWLQVLRDNVLGLCDEKMPKKIKVGGFIYDVVFPYFFRDATGITASQVSQDQLTIWVADRDGPDEYNLDFIKLNVVLMVLACIDFMYFNGGLECGDSNLKSLAAGIHQVFKDNKIEELVKKAVD